MASINNIFNKCFNLKKEKEKESRFSQCETYFESFYFFDEEIKITAVKSKLY